MRHTTTGGRLIYSAAIVFVVQYAYAIEAFSDKGTWPTTWPKELESLRKQAVSINSGTDNRVHYEIHFDERQTFEAAWPHLLKLKSKGAPLVILRSPDKDSDRILRAGVRVWPSVFQEQGEHLATPWNPNASNLRARWMNATFIELVVDEEIVNLNRIFLPADTPIIDRRFEDGEKR